MKAPEFTATAVVDRQFKEISLSDYQGRNVVLFFYPLDFTFVCPTEIVAFSDRIEEFKCRETDVIGVSVDSHFSHLAWIETPRSSGGINDLRYPLVSDITKAISRSYGVLLESGGIALRGLFLIDREQIIRHMVINDLPLGRSIDETLRVIDALTHFETYGEVCPADWRPGNSGIIPGVQEASVYFAEFTNTTTGAAEVPA